MSRGWHHPMEPTSGSVPGDEVRFVGGITVMAATVEHPDLGHVPTLVFRFVAGDGLGAPQPIALVLDAHHLEQLPKLLEDGVRLAKEAAEVKNRV